MPYLCRSCGNRLRFRVDGTRTREVRETLNGTFVLNENGTLIHFGFGEILDDETIRIIGDEYERSEIICSNCHETPEMVSQEEWNRYEREDERDDEREEDNEDEDEYEEVFMDGPRPKPKGKLDDIKKHFEVD